MENAYVLKIDLGFFLGRRKNSRYVLWKFDLQTVQCLNEKHANKKIIKQTMISHVDNTGSSDW